MLYRRVQIRTRGIIPGLWKRGPLPDIELDIDTIADLVDRGVDVVTVPDGVPFEEVLKKMAAAEKTPTPAVTPAVEVTPKTPAPKPLPTREEDLKPVEKPAEEKVEEPPVIVGETKVDDEEDDGGDDFADETSDVETAINQGAAPMLNPDGTPMSKNQMKKARRAAAQAAANGQTAQQ